MRLKHTDMRTRRLNLGLAQREVAQRARVRETQLRKWERGLELPDPESARRLGAVLDVDPDRLLKAQEVHSETVTPGEGYTTAVAGKGYVVSRSLDTPFGTKRVLDLFCGAGGLSFGFEQSGGFVTTCGIDLLPDRIETFVANHKYATGVAGDLRAYTLQELQDLTGGVDVMVGGPPCQGFSSIRPFRNLTEGDPRNSLVEHYVLVINHLRPEWFVFENVVGILTHESGSRLYAVLEGLRGAGYSVEWRVINAALYGVPQHRERVVIVGNRKGIPFVWPSPTHRVDYKSMAGSRKEVVRSEPPLFSGEMQDAVTLMQAIDDLPPIPSGGEATEYIEPPRTDYQRRLRRDTPALTLHKATNHSAKMLDIIRHAGSNISALPPGMVKSGFSSCYSRLDADRPSTTLTVNFVHPASNRCIHPYQDRALTPREGARIQSFPDHFQFRGKSAQIVKQIGNAVPPLLGQRIAEAILYSEEVAATAHRALPRNADKRRSANKAGC
jgi:DNA (cytosine-5)-methyltransferase 1